MVGFLSLLCCLRKSLRDKIDALWVLLFFSALGIWAQSEVVSYIGVRTTWYSAFFSIVLFFHIINKIYPSPLFKRQLPSLICFGLIVSATFVNLSAGTIETQKMAKMERFFQDSYFKTPQPYCFIDMTAVKRPSILAFNRLSFLSQARHTEYWCWKTICAWYGYNYRLSSRPIPCELKDFTILRGTKIPGNNPFYEYKGWVIMPFAYFGHTTWKLHFNCNRRSHKDFIASPFVNDEGELWLYVDFSPEDYLTRWFRITKIER